MPHVFLSYSRADDDLMNQLRADLRAGGFDVWTDTGIKPGTPSWKRAIEDAIRGAGCVVAILSPDAAQSRWVREELDFAEAQGKQIFLILARGDKDDSVPFGFSTHQWVDIRRDYVPIKDVLIPALRDYLRHAPAAEPDIVTDAPSVHIAATPKPPKRNAALIIGVLAIAGTVAALVFIAPQFVPQAAPTQPITPIATATLPVTDNEDNTPTIQAFDGVEMVFVPTGCFMMGSETGPGDEQPVAGQCIDTPYWIDRFEVTNAVFAQFEGRALQPSYWSEASEPRTSLTWNEARDFCEDRRGGRLPTELEWEYAARGPDNLIYPWGDDFKTENVVSDIENEATVVGSRPTGASWVGALDMSGNVWEWVSTLYTSWELGLFPYPYDADDGREDSERTDLERVMRGGSYRDASDVLRAAYRQAQIPFTRAESIGFRCVRDV
jgi:gamma-glutamyl hercynylcysteine S-oxide synthase